MANPFEKINQEQTPAMDDLSVLSSSYVPENFPHREQQIDSMVKSLSSIMRHGRASNLLLYGKSGTGKTSISRYVTQLLQEAGKGSIKVVYINCQITDSTYSILVYLVNSLSERDEERIPPMGWTLDRVYSELITRIGQMKKYIVVVLDEIDKLIEKNGGDSLYVILKASDDGKEANLSIIGITNYTSFADNLDARVRSRLNQESIIFQPYNATQLRDILKDRMGGIVSHTVVEDSALNLCAAIGAREHGDARKAIDLLRISMEIAIREGKSRVGEAEVYKARDKFETDVIKESIMALPLHSKIILLSVVLSQKFANRPAYTGEVYENYKRICEEISVQNLGFRRISEILSDLDDIGLIVSVTKSMGRGGRTRFIRVPDHIDSIEQHILEDEQLSTFKGVKLTKQEKLSGLEDESHQDIDNIFNSQRSD